MRDWKRKVGPTINYSGAPGRSDRRYNLAMTNEGWSDLDALRRALPDASVAQIITNALRLAVKDDMPEKLRAERALSALTEEQPPQQDSRG